MRDAQRRDRNSAAQDPHSRFYTLYDREAKAFDGEYAWTCREALSNVLVFVRRFILFPGGMITH